MNTINAINSALPLPTPAPAPTVSAVPAASLPAAAVVQQQTANPSGVDVQAAEQKRLETVQKAAQAVANIYVLGDQSITIFKDATGQYITRYTSLRGDGKVTYIPEPSLPKLSDGGSTLDLKA